MFFFYWFLAVPENYFVRLILLINETRWPLNNFLKISRRKDKRKTWYLWTHQNVMNLSWEASNHFWVLFFFVYLQEHCGVSIKGCGNRECIPVILPSTCNCWWAFNSTTSKDLANFFSHWGKIVFPHLLLLLSFEKKRCKECILYLCKESPSVMSGYTS